MSYGQRDEQSFPVTVAVPRPDGSVEQVRVGTATRSGDGFTLRMGELSIGGTPLPAAPSRAQGGYGAGASAGGAGGAPPPGAEGMVFPPYGRSKGMPIAGASLQDLEYYAAGSRRSLANPEKARWHDKERVLLGAIEAEISRQTGEEPRFVDDGAPPPGAPRSGGGGGAAGGGGRPFDDGVPPPGDDDIPF